MSLNRRFFLKSLGTAACSAAAHPWLSTVTLAKGAAALGDNRLIVVILRGAMDGLDVLQPRGDVDFVAARPGLSLPPALDLPAPRMDGFFHLHAGLTGLMPLWQAGELAFVHATSTPYRDKRSHFDGQDVLEAGTGADVGPASHRDGWLNRLLQAVPGVSAETAYAVGREEMLILSGAADTRSWAPDQQLVLSAQGRLLLDHVAHDDPLFRDAVGEALELTEAQGAGLQAGDEVDGLVDFTAQHLRGQTRIASFSLTGWDTHKGQEKALRRPLDRLGRVIARMKEQLGPQVWGKTALLAMTEFGRTLRENGSGGTDHGTGGLMLAAGGAVRGGQVLGAWPGLDEAALYARRDLMPTSDVRDWAAQAMAGLYGLDRNLLESSIFPGLQMQAAPGLIR
ncbi:MAG: DUF1501 domain-containing protein [Paracoccaceae bacterium]